MDIYLVGGAVRDKLLGRPVLEKDWVVVGASPETMTSLGYTPVGKDFPVFLHPQTKEEYALARTERKTGRGYGGFAFNCDAKVSLEEDLLRRDLTVNAMAEDDEGNIIDPFNGQRDLRDRHLRHVSPAFAEDPVRILRIARFAARYHGLGFKVADETLTLMREMVDAGEVDYLVAERVWRETQRALAEPYPAVFIETLRQCGALARLFPEVDALFGVPQTAVHHPEIDTGIHCLLCLEQAAHLSSDPLVRFATLVHDLGKGTTPETEWPRHIAHEIRSLPLIHQLCDRIAVPRDYRDLGLLVAQWHTHCHRALELKSSTLLKTLQVLDAFRRPDRFELFLLCCEADARGRTGFEDREYPQADFFRRALAACRTVDMQLIAQRELKGSEVGAAIEQQRLHLLKKFKASQRSEPDMGDNE